MPDPNSSPPNLKELPVSMLLRIAETCHPSIRPKVIAELRQRGVQVVETGENNNA